MEITYRFATESDLIEIVKMLSDDKLGTSRERFELPLPKAYTEAFTRIVADPYQELMVAELNTEIAFGIKSGEPNGQKSIEHKNTAFLN